MSILRSSQYVTVLMSAFMVLSVPCDCGARLALTAAMANAGPWWGSRSNGLLRSGPRRNAIPVPGGEASLGRHIHLLYTWPQDRMEDHAMCPPGFLQAISRGAT